MRNGDLSQTLPPHRLPKYASRADATAADGHHVPPRPYGRDVARLRLPSPATSAVE